MSRINTTVRTAPFSTLLGAFVLGAATLGLSGCEVTEARSEYRPGPVCPQNYSPVCAERRGHERTFPNACQARQSDWRIVYSGQCRADGYGDYRPNRADRHRNARDRDDWGRDSRVRDDIGRDDRDRDRVDPRDRNRDRNRLDNQPRRDRNLTPARPTRPAQTTTPARPNTQVRPARPARPIKPARPAAPAQPAAPTAACPQIIEQVCGQLGGTAKMFPNRCTMRLAGAVEVAAGACMGGNR
tara:strand:- start:2940 stop:3665 length:726 start_codon:yes stop_codon:yes gene_type:complete